MNLIHKTRERKVGLRFFIRQARKANVVTMRYFGAQRCCKSLGEIKK